MFDWLADIYKLCNRISDQDYIHFAKQGATEAELSALEAQLGVTLPTSYRIFLSRWNGAELRASHILSTDELLQWSQTAGFSPFSGDVAATLSDVHLYYAHKPAYHLVFRTFDLGSDVYCLHTQVQSEGEYPVCKYDVENSLEGHLRPRFPSFEAMLLCDIFDLVVEDAAFMIGDSDEAFSEETVAELEAAFAHWENRLTMMLTERGLI